MILEVDGINTYYGVSHILFDVSLKIDRGEIVCLLGRNGSGKTTTIRSIMGLTPPRSGSIRFQGQEICHKSPTTIAHMGIGFVPEDRRVFPDLTVRQNLEVAMKTGADNIGQWTLDRVYGLFPKLKTLEKARGAYLSGGEQQMLTIARTLMGNPTILLLDEPSAGLAPLLVNALGEQIKKLSGEGVTILLAEQNVKLTMDVSHRGYVLSEGQIKYQGSIPELRKNNEIMAKYLGV